VVGDFNGDGKLDLVTANQGSGSGNPGSANLTILLGDGSGNFSAAAGSPFALSGIPVALSAGPIASPQAGLAIANQGGTITVLQSDAVGNFSEAAGSPVSMSSSLAAMVVKDFDNDGKPDFAALDAVSDSLILKLNRTASSSTIVATNIAVTGGGSHSVTAVYSGDSIYPASTSDAVTLTATTAPDFTIASATASQTIAPGQTGNYTISLTAQNGFTGAVALSCSGLPSGYTCGFTPPSLTLSAAIATSVMTVSSTSIAWTGDGKINPARLSSIQPFRRSMVWLLSSMTLFLLALARKVSTKGYAVRLACMMIVFAAAVSMQGCGNAPLTPPLSTTSTVTVTGTSGTLTHSTSVTLITKVAE
jgi:FG-GAP repeat